MLLEKYLYGVVSLPAGVFNPYSGVKTSILLLDRQIASKSDAILFVKIENDGLALGAQRREIDKNDLPDALKVINEFRKNINHEPHKQHEQKEEKKPQRTQSSRREEKIKNAVSANRKFNVSSVVNYLVVSKDTIAENGEYNLAGERYRVVERRGKQKWEMVRLGDVCEIKTGKKDVNEGNPEGQYPFFTCAKEHTFSDSYSFDMEALLIAGNGDVGSVKYYNGRFEAYQRTYVLSKFENALPQYLYYFLNIKLKATMAAQKLGNTMPYIKLGMLQNFEIPLPPLEIQRKIVTEIEGYQKVIDGARQVVDNWKPEIKVECEWPMVKLGDVCDVRDGTHDSPQYIQKQDFPLITSKNLKNGYIDFSDVNYISKTNLDKINERSLVDDGDIIMPMIGTIGNPVIVKKEREFAVKNVALIKFVSKSKVLNQFVKELLDSRASAEYFRNNSSGSTQKFISLGFIRDMKIPIPSIKIQQEIVAKIESERKLVDGCRELMVRYEGKIKRVVDGVWGE